MTRHRIGAQVASRAEYVILDSSAQGTYLYRFDTTGTFVGDTWHANVDDGRHQAAFEFAADLGEWTSVPADVIDLADFARGLAAGDETDSRG